MNDDQAIKLNDVLDQRARMVLGVARNRVEFPLLLEFELRHDAWGIVKKRAGFRDWDHYLKYVEQMMQRNKIEVRKPVVVPEPTQ